MSKELYVSSTPHETKVAVVEDDQLAEIYFERENEYTLAGSIYKGRVTRVLPGMQSAFVNIGLERDAFLYVSDFFEMEDEDEQIEPVNVRTHRNAVGAFPEPQAQRPEPIQAAHAEGAPAMEFTGGYDEPSEAPAQGDAAAGEEGEAGARRWRGRRRRRGGRRGRGMPEAKFAEGEARPEGEESSAEPMEELVEGPGPVQLPGESLSRHAHAEESREEQEPEASDQESAEAAYETEAETETPDSRPPAAESRPDRVVLPGESFTPRQPRSEASGFDRDREPRRDRFGRGDRGDRGGRGGRFGRDRDRGRGFDRGDRGERHERPEVSPPPAGYEPIILPGESLSKYKGRQPASPAGESGHAVESISSGVVHDESPQETMQHGEPPVIESPSFQQEYAETPVEHEPREIADEARGRDSQSQPTSTPEREQPRRQRASSDEQRPAKRGFFDRFRSMNVAEIFGGKEAEPDTEPELAHPPLAEPAPTGAFSDADAAPRETQGAVESQHDESHSEVISAHHAQPVVGAFEEEEIDEEETDLPAYADQFADEDGDFEELEEETLEPAEAHGSRSEPAMGEMLTETVEEHESDQAAPGGGVEAYEGEDGEGEFEEEEASGRAELRAPAGTAGYQQRTQQRPQFDRHGRGRRGGRRMRRVETRPHVMISDVLKEGQEVLVQIAKEPIGKKGARITSHIALPGRFLVYMPTVNHIGVSRKIASDEERQRLKRIVTSERENGHGGFIVRTAAENVREDELRNDIRFLKNLWNEIKNRTDNSKPPALIYHDLNLVERILRDLVTEDFTAIWVDTEQEYERVLRFVNRFQPNLVRRVKLYTKETPLFEQFGIQEEINKALKSKVWLKSGGYIVINQTEALVAIDVNTGKYVGKTQRLEDTIVKTNVDAIREIVRQIRLRDLGGIIVIDFIDMDERRNRQKVMAALEDALRSDRSPSKVLQFNDFGLVAITRKRVKHSLERTLGNPCPYCTGTGLVKSVETVCNEIFTEMKKMARHLEGRDVMLRVNPDVAKALKENNGRWLSDYEELTGKTVIVKSDALLHQEQFDMH